MFRSEIGHLFSEITPLICPFKFSLVTISICCNNYHHYRFLCFILVLKLGKSPINSHFVHLCSFYLVNELNQDLRKIQKKIVFNARLTSCVVSNNFLYWNFDILKLIFSNFAYHQFVGCTDHYHRALTSSSLLSKYFPIPSHP